MANLDRVPAIYVYRDQTEAGGLMSYSYDIKGAVRTNARQIVDILHGARPSEMPYEQASRFELVINLKTAKALGLEIPANMLARADAVIE
jgi:putative ABC transport system substrate-binding protein